ncbi:uncharacterized protein [Rutidosis leptorrhynchoides]|uniref:uncharacterized protein n=1 Tax=Rutidosis leptorrhynchoides TaxID=125765 RepID=UPI003A9A2234
MPTFTTVALDSLIEPKASKLATTDKTRPEPKLERKNRTMTIQRKHHWTQISPTLYTTPEPTPVPHTPLSFPTSPYIVDHKRRGPRLSKTYSDDGTILHKAVTDDNTVEIKKSVEAEDIGSTKALDLTDTVVSGDIKYKYVKFQPNQNSGSGDISAKSDALEREGEVDDFYDPNDTTSVRSSTDGETNHGLERSLNTPFAEFYDAWEELASETGIQHTATDTEGELRELQTGFLIEMEKRKQAETHLNDIKSQWGRIREQLSVVGLSFPADPSVTDDEQSNDPGEDVSRQVHLLRFVSNSVGRGMARAELEVEMEAQLQSKNFEIARLLDRLHYYEAVNHEMSQRNQESVETMRRLRQRRKTRQRWIWGSIGVAITLGSAALAWSYLPTGKASSQTHTSESKHSVK